ncbi:MAG: hypothetical protein VBE63_28375 [Lamprobacter sp.]|uniref:hypothetical protein n=1 Tax=Lamprobacter sp. TaxID=3100796 RepID=UPI002B257965|nr:hypothetical protein [Lamprobacter sp.]MEA3643811.1 hypothetical protein [Lamprobacter sp.]
MQRLVAVPARLEGERDQECSAFLMVAWHVFKHLEGLVGSFQEREDIISRETIAGVVVCIVTRLLEFDECTSDDLDVSCWSLGKEISEPNGWLFGLPFRERLAHILHLFVLEGSSDFVAEVFAVTAGDKILAGGLNELVEQGVVGG